jgi:hypothetical protein
VQIAECKPQIAQGDRRGAAAVALKFVIRTLQFALCKLVVISLPGCSSSGTVAGYAAGETYDDSVRTVAVHIFENRTFFRDVEFKLTEALAKELESRTPYKVARAGGADTILTGTVMSVDKRLLSREFTTGVPQEVQVVVVASFEWKDLRTGEIRRKRSRVEGTGEHIPTRPLSEPFEVARHAAVAELAREIVSAMRKDW